MIVESPARPLASCASAACGQPLFGAVMFCPYCGTAQAATGALPAGAGARAGTYRMGRRNGTLEPVQAQADGAAAVAAPEPAARAEPLAPAPAPAERAAVASAALPASQGPGPQAQDVAAARQASRSAAAAAAPPRRRRRWPNVVLFMAVLYAAYLGFQHFAGPDACHVALAAAQAAATTGDARRALGLANQAVATCDTDARADTARKLAQASQAQIAAQASCERALASSAEQLAAGRPRQALRVLGGLSGACANRPEAASRRAASESARSQAADKLAQAAEPIARGAGDAARALIDAAEQLDRDNPDIAASRRALTTALAAPDPLKAASAIDAMLRAADRREWNALEGLGRELRRAAATVSGGDRASSDRANAEGVAQLRGRDLNGAISAFRRAVAADASSAEALNNLGYALLQTGALGDAHKLLTQALAQAPNRSVAWVNLGEALALGDRPQDAVNALRIGLRYSINRKVSIDALTHQRDTTPNPKVREALARVLRDPQDPVAILFPDNPPDVGTDLAEARNCLAERNLDCAERAARRVQAKVPDQPEAAATLRRVSELRAQARRVINEGFK